MEAVYVRTISKYINTGSKSWIQATIAKYIKVIPLAIK